MTKTRNRLQQAARDSSSWPRVFSFSSFFSSWRVLLDLAAESIEKTKSMLLVNIHVIQVFKHCSRQQTLNSYLISRNCVCSIIGSLCRATRLRYVSSKFRRRPRLSDRSSPSTVTIFSIIVLIGTDARWRQQTCSFISGVVTVQIAIRVVRRITTQQQKIITGYIELDSQHRQQAILQHNHSLPVRDARAIIAGFYGWSIRNMPRLFLCLLRFTFYYQ